MTRWLLILMITMGGAARISWGTEMVIRSSAIQTHLIELYSSEGCSSSPPADDWLRSLRNSPRLWTGFVPLAFHVDYWNHLGWSDPFSSASHSRRQQELFRSWGIERVCTPCFALNGEAWQGGVLPEASTAIRGELALALDRGEARIRFSPAASAAIRRTAWLALLSGPVSSQVSAGENAGRRLSHEFVVLDLGALEMSIQGDAWIATAQVSLSPAVRAVAAWVSQEGSLAPEQATGGWLPVQD